MFEFGEKSFLGVDIGTSSIKMVEIKVKENKPILLNYAWMKIPIIPKNTGLTSSETFLAECFTRLIKEGKFSNGSFFLSIQSFGALVTLMDLPALPKEDLEQAIQFEAHKYIPTSLDEVSLSWGITKKESENGKTQVLLVAVPKNKIIKYENIVKRANLKLNAIEIETFSLVRSLVGNDGGNFILVDIGSRVCNIILVEKGEVKVSRNIDAGGKDITRAIAVGLSVDEERAENLKLSKMEFLGKEANIVFTCLDLIVGEIKRILATHYNNSNPSENIDGIILSGGTANLVGLDGYFANKLNVKVIIGNPFGRVSYNKNLETTIKEIGPQFSVAVGLALKGLES